MEAKHEPRLSGSGYFSLADKVAALRLPQSYPAPPARIECIETHMSFVFLTPEHAYKLKKPVRYEFLDFSTLEARRHDSAEELRLNTRLAPGVYLAVVPLTVEAGGVLRIGGQGECIEWLVKMRRLPAGRMLDRLILDNKLARPELDTLATRLADFYSSCPSEAITAAELRERLAQDLDANHAVLTEPAFGLPARQIDALHATQRGFLERQAGLFESRVHGGCIVEGHGDLRPEHVCLLDPPVVFDCLEFNRRLRIVDPLDELAFLAMECERLGAEHVGSALIQAYAARRGETIPDGLIAYYKCARACMRARLSLLHTREIERAGWVHWIARANEYLTLAQRHALRL